MVPFPKSLESDEYEWMSGEEVVARLGTDLRHGLTNEEAELRIGYNILFSLFVNDLVKIRLMKNANITSQKWTDL